MRLLLACAGFRPLYKVLGRDMNSKETLFAGLAGLRGSVSLILAQAVITEDKGGDSTSQVGNRFLERGKGGKTIPERKRGKRGGRLGKRRMQMFTVVVVVVVTTTIIVIITIIITTTTTIIVITTISLFNNDNNNNSNSNVIVINKQVFTNSNVRQSSPSRSHA